MFVSKKDCNGENNNLSLIIDELKTLKSYITTSDIVIKLKEEYEATNCGNTSKESNSQINENVEELSPSFETPMSHCEYSISDLGSSILHFLQNCEAVLQDTINNFDISNYF